MIQKELCKAAAGKAVLGNKVPVWKTILAGEKVPVDVYRVEDGGRVDFNLETGRFSCRIGGGVMMRKSWMLPAVWSRISRGRSAILYGANKAGIR